MRLDEPLATTGWKAELALGFERRGAKSVLAARRHDGPLALQKPLYPEGEGVCHAIVLHPPGGIAGGDELEIAARVGEGAHALLTTPGAGKWYRSAGAWARQSLGFEVARGACLEWLPQETIVFDGALAGMRSEVRLEGARAGCCGTSAGASRADRRCSNRRPACAGSPWRGHCSRRRPKSMTA